MAMKKTKRGRELKWTQELRRIMYARIVMEFGPHDGWGKDDYPAGKKERFNKVLQELADYFCQLTNHSFETTALEQQINWGWTRQETVLEPARARNFILNKAAALETGFIRSADLPAGLLAANT